MVLMRTYKNQINEVNGLKTLVIETERLLLESFEPKHLVGIYVFQSVQEIDGHVYNCYRVKNL